MLFARHVYTVDIECPCCSKVALGRLVPHNNVHTAYGFVSGTGREARRDKNHVKQCQRIEFDPRTRTLLVGLEANGM